jgi:hypothetical protein
MLRLFPNRGGHESAVLKTNLFQETYILFFFFFENVLIKYVHLICNPIDIECIQILLNLVNHLLSHSVERSLLKKLFSEEDPLYLPELALECYYRLLELNPDEKTCKRPTVRSWHVFLEHAFDIVHV